MWRTWVPLVCALICIKTCVMVTWSWPDHSNSHTIPLWKQAFVESGWLSTNQTKSSIAINWQWKEKIIYNACSMKTRWVCHSAMIRCSSVQWHLNGSMAEKWHSSSHLHINSTWEMKWQQGIFLNLIDLVNLLIIIIIIRLNSCYYFLTSIS